MTHPGESKTSPRRIEAVERARKALELRIRGADFEGIAKALGYADRSGAYRAVKAALDRVPAHDAKELRRINLERLNRLRLKNSPGVEEADPKALGMELSIQEREARYLGLDAPAKSEHTGKDGGPIDVTLRVVYDDGDKTSD